MCDSRAASFSADTRSFICEETVAAKTREETKIKVHMREQNRDQIKDSLAEGCTSRGVREADLQLVKDVVIGDGRSTPNGNVGQQKVNYPRELPARRSTVEKQRNMKRN
jgi:hypothetical protein